MMQCVIIANRGAGSFSRQTLDRVCTTLSANGFAPELRICSDFGDISWVADTVSSLPENPLVIAAGGDGTINAVFNGLAGNSATCAILPMGTANVMAIELDIRTPEQAVARIVSGESRPFTAGLIRNSGRESRFFLMTGAGLDGQVVRDVSLREKRLFGKGAYALSAFRSLLSWDNDTLRVTTENEEFSCSTLIVCNAAHYGGPFRLAPAGSIFSPDFQIIAIMGNSRSSVLGAVAEAALGKNSAERLLRITAKRLSITGLKPVQADGDYWGDSPAVIQAEPGYARIII